MIDIKNVAVLGAGLMGKQIGLNTALYGYNVVVYDSVKDVIDEVVPWAEDYVRNRVLKGKMEQDRAEKALTLLKTERDLQNTVKDADLIIEAIVEDRKVKETLFTNISKYAKENAIIATNSSFMVSSLFAPFVKNPARLCNLHYFNPALVMKLTEVVQGPHTSEETVKTLLDFSRQTGKDPVWVRKEIDGFIANRFMRAIKNEACYLLEEGIATPQEIDIAVEKGLNHPMGPFRLMDLVGIDLSYLASKRVLEETGEKQPGFDAIEEKYIKGEWGKKAGKGWYNYTNKEA